MNTSRYSQPFILIPAYLEEPSIFSVLTDITKHGYRNIIVVDDGSPDGTYDEAKRISGIILTRHLINRGKGAAMRTAFELARQYKAECVVTVDADGQHNPNDIEKLLSALNEGNDVAMGTRMTDTKNMPASKRLANWIGNFFTLVLFGVKVSDSQCGLRAYSKKALEVIETKSDRYAYDTEIIREIKHHKLTFAEVPIDTLYNKHSQTKAERQTFMGGIRTLSRMITSI